MIVGAAPGWGFPGSIPGSALLANPGGLQIKKGLVMNELEKDGARWRAMNNSVDSLGVFCAACDSVGIRTVVDHETCAVVAWDVLGDSRSFAFVCPGCAVAPGVVCEFCAAPCLATGSGVDSAGFNVEVGICSRCSRIADGVEAARTLVDDGRLSADLVWLVGEVEFLAGLLGVAL